MKQKAKGFIVEQKAHETGDEMNTTTVCCKVAKKRLLGSHLKATNRLYLFTNRAVVIGIQDLDLHDSFGSEDAITGSDVKEVTVLLLAV